MCSNVPVNVRSVSMLSPKTRDPIANSASNKGSRENSNVD